MSNTDPQGYGQLRDTLVEIERALRARDQPELAAAMVEAQGFYGYNGSEFVGESRLALAEVVAARVLDKPTQALAREAIKNIDIGIRAVGSVPMPTEFSQLWPTLVSVIRAIWRKRNG